MVYPILAFALGSSAMVSSYLGYRTSSYNTEYAKKVYEDNVRYWKDYTKNTGVVARYPYRTGYTPSYGSVYAGEQAQWQNMTRILYW